MILMVVGGIGAVLSVAHWASWGGFSRRTSVAGTGTPQQRREPMDILVFLLLVFVVFLVAGWGWRSARGRR